jgi:precorrin-2/cobalt-factor-2 C20-methyltransferase
LFGVGVGPGDPELMTIKARRVIGECAVVAHFAARRRPGNAWSIVEPLVTESQSVLRLEYPVTIDAVEADDYERLLLEFYDRVAATIASHLDTGQDVAVVCEGDPFFYGSYMYVHERLAHRYTTTVVPGVTSFSAASAAAGLPLVSRNETFTVLSGVQTAEQLKDALAGVDAAVVMKVGRHLDDVRAAVQSAGLAEHAVYVERATWPDERVVPIVATDGIDAPYFSIVLIPGGGVARRHQR